MATSDTAFELSVKWEQSPGWRKPEITAHGPHEVIAAILHQISSSPNFAFNTLLSIEVKRAS